MIEAKYGASWVGYIYMFVKVFLGVLVFVILSDIIFGALKFAKVINDEMTNIN